MADVLDFPAIKEARGQRLQRLRDHHDGFRAVADVCELAARHQQHLPPVFLNELYGILSREGDAAERRLAAGVTIDLTAERPDEPA